MNNNVKQTFFNSDLKLNDTSPEILVNNLALFFEEEGKPLLNGDIATLDAIEKCITRESEEYTRKLIEKQNLDKANNAWNEGNYNEFIKCMDGMDKQKLPPSYELKYKMALKKRAQ